MARSMRTTARRGSGAAAWAACLLFATAAPADPEQAAAEPPGVREARDAYRIGASLVVAGQWSDALASFERSSRLRPHGVTTFNIAYCERALGRFTRARKSFRRALGAPELPADKAVEARRYLAEIEGRLARAAAALKPRGASVAVDGRPLELAEGDDGPELVAGTRDPGQPEAVSARSFTLVLDPGTHVIVVSVLGLPDAVLTRDFAPGVTTTVMLVSGSPPAVATTSPVRGNPPTAWSTRRIGAAVAFGVGGAAAVVGAVFGGLALKTKGNLDSLCLKGPGQCLEFAQLEIDTLSRFATVSTVGVALACAGAAVGTSLVLAADGPRPAVTLSLGPAYAGVRGSF